MRYNSEVIRGGSLAKRTKKGDTHFSKDSVIRVNENQSAESRSNQMKSALIL